MLPLDRQRGSGHGGEESGARGEVEADLRRSHRWVTGAAIAALLAAAATLVGLVSYLDSATWWVDHTDQVISAVTGVEQLVADRHTRLRGVLLTGVPPSRSALAQADGRALGALAELEQLVSDNPAQVARLRALRAAVAAATGRVAEERVAPRARQDVVDALVAADSAEAGIQSALRELARVEEGLRATRAARVHAVTHASMGISALLALFGAPALGLTTARRMRRSRQRYRRALDARDRSTRSLAASEEALRRYSELVQHAPVLVRDLESRIVVWNEGMKRLYGWETDEVLGRSSHEVLGTVSPEPLPEVMAKVLQDGRWEGELVHHRRDGTEVVVASSWILHRDAAGQPNAVIETNTDVTASKRAQEALRDSDRKKDEFLGVLSHELRNPLAPIRNSVHILARVAPDSAQAERARTIIARQVDHLARLVDDLLDVKRISTGKLRLHTGRLDLREPVLETVEDLRPLFVRHSLSLELAVPESPVWVEGDETRLAQVVGNLLHNAAKFTNPGGHVRVSLVEDAGRAQLGVLDDGVGAAPETLETLFHPFVQSDKTLHRSKGGLGLGLSLVRGIAELHGGSVSARSAGLGQGAEFVVTLPTTQAAAAVEARAAPPRRSGQCRVLIVEDNRDAAESLRDIVQLIGGHEVETVFDGADAIDAARRLRPDVVLCDLGLPTIDGYEVARRLRAGDVAPQARLVALSGYASPEDVDRAIRAGFDYHVPKPPDVEEVLRLVAEAPSRDGARLAVPDGLATGHREVDAQHADMFAALARLRTATPAAAWEALRFLYRHTISHFKYEDALMENVRFPDVAAHRRQHAEFLALLQTFEQRLNREGTTTENRDALVALVERWVTEHVLEEDRRIAVFIRERRPGGAEPVVASVPLAAQNPGPLRARVGPRHSK